MFPLVKLSCNPLWIPGNLYLKTGESHFQLMVNQTWKCVNKSHCLWLTYEAHLLQCCLNLCCSLNMQNIWPSLAHQITVVWPSICLNSGSCFFWTTGSFWSHIIGLEWWWIYASLQVWCSDSKASLRFIQNIVSFYSHIVSSFQKAGLIFSLIMIML